MTPEKVKASGLKRAVVTGGAGFIGSHIVDALIAAGLEVLVIDDFSTGLEGNLTAAQAGSRVKIYRGDICDSAVVGEIEKFKPDVILHQAAQINVRRSVADPVFDGQRNVIGTINILEAARRSGTKRLLMASTGGAIYGEQETFPAPEEHPVHAECPYGVSKRAAELYLEYYARAHSMVCVALRYANVYGPRQNAKGEAGVVAIFAERLLANEELVVNGDGKQTRDFVYVGDVVSANLAALVGVTKNGFYVFNVGCSEESTVLDIVSGIAKAWSEKKGGPLISAKHGPALPGEQRRSVVDTARIRRELGWSPSMKLDHGLAHTLQSFIDRQGSRAHSS